MAKKKVESAPKPNPTEMQAKVAALNQKIDANAISLSEMTDIIQETVVLSELISKLKHNPDSSFGKELAATNAQVVQVAEEAAAMALLLAYVKNEISKL